MRKVLISIGVFLVAVAMAHGQGVPVNGEVIKSTAGQAGSVRVCTKDAISTPCTILANIYKDEALTIPEANPLPTDAYGNYFYYVAPGTYKEQVTAGKTTRTTVISVGGGTSEAAEFPLKYANSAADIDATISNCGSEKCTVIIPGYVGDGYPTSIPDNVTVIDYRSIKSPNLSGSENSYYGYGELIRRTFTSTMELNKSKGGLGVYCAALTGGINRGANEAGGHFKANYVCGSVWGTWRTPGQHSIFGASGNNYSLGDHFGYSSYLTDWGGASAQGDESTQGFAARLYEGEAIFSAMVSSVSGDTVSFTNGSNLDTLGEGRYLINLSRTHSTGTVASVSGNVFTFSGAGLATKYGAGDKTNLCLAIDANTMTVGATPHKLVNLITNIADDNTATIKWGYPQVNGVYPSRLATSGTYTIYACSPVTYVGVSYQSETTTGSVKVADSSVFSATDSVELPVWYQHNKGGISAYMTSSGYNQGALYGGRFDGPGTLRNGFIFQNSGNIERFMEVTGPGMILDYGFYFNRSIGNNVPIVQDTPPVGVTNYARRFLSTWTGQGNQTMFGFQMDETTGGYWYMGRSGQNNLTVGESGAGINLAPQANARLSIKSAAGNYGIVQYKSTTGTAFDTDDSGNLFAAGSVSAGSTVTSTLAPSTAGTDKAFVGNNSGPEVARNGVHITGNFQRGIEFSDGALSVYGITFNKSIGTNIPMIQDFPATGATDHNRRFLATWTGTGAQTYMGFQMSATANLNYWYTTLEFRTPKLGGITDTTIVTNFNADQVDGKHAADFAPATIISGTPTVNRAVCWKTATTLGYCSTAPDASGACTCN